MSPSRLLLVLVLLLSSLSLCPGGSAQVPNQRLVLKDGTYQVVTKYQKVGDRVRYFSAERGQWEELPATLVDWAATEAWAKDHKPGAEPVSPAVPEAAAIDKEEQHARARTPDVSPGLRLPDQDGVWALDTFHDQPELVALTQNSGGVNRETSHNVLRAALNPLGGIQQSVQIPGAESRVKLHVNDPAFYVSIVGVDDNEADSSAVTVDTRGAGSAKEKNPLNSANSQYAIVRVRSNFKKDYRVVSGIKIGVGGKVTQTEDVIPTTVQVLPGNRWIRLTPQQPLTIGDFALMELLGPGEVNLSVWDFRIDPQGPDNKNALMPLQRSSDNDR
ncbi:MAG: hypothetical protein QOH35_5235 [Acidobacteriaceae bacterium]|jgi:hypothetical protein|nr:hypothetical protein [Acidobacteriaceae bacterium]